MRRTLEAFARDGLNASFEGLVADDVELRPVFELAGGRRFIGITGFTRFMREWTEALDDWTLRVDDLLDAGEAVVATLHQSARGKASGVAVGGQFGVVFRLRDGHIARMEAYKTVAQALKAVGLAE